MRFEGKNVLTKEKQQQLSFRYIYVHIVLHFVR